MVKWRGNEFEDREICASKTGDIISDYVRYQILYEIPDNYSTVFMMYNNEYLDTYWSFSLTLLLPIISEYLLLTEHLLSLQ